MRLARKSAVALALVLLIACRSAPAPEPAADLSLLFSQTAESATLTPADGTDAYVLTMSGVDAHTVRFADRPAREATVIPTSHFVATFGAMFGDVAPNAALVEHAPDGATDTLILVISNPVYDNTVSTLRYDVTVLADEQHPERLAGFGRAGHAEPPSAMGAVSLFIDNAAGPSTSTCQLGPNAKCSGVDLHGANLSNWDLSGADLSNANLVGTKLINANLSGANLSGANATGADLSGADVRGASFGGARLDDATFRGGWIDGGVTGAVDYTGADFSATHLDVRVGDDFSGAQLSGAILTSFPTIERGRPQVFFRGANLSGARFGSVKGDPCRLQDAATDSRNFPPDTFAIVYADFDEANLTMADLSCSLLFNVTMRGANLDDVSWANSIVFGVDFTGASNLSFGVFGGPAFVCWIYLPSGIELSDGSCGGWALVAAETTSPSGPSPTPCSFALDLWPFSGTVCIRH